MPLPVNGRAFYQRAKTYHLCSHTIYFEHYEVTILTVYSQIIWHANQEVIAKLAGIICGNSIASQSVDPRGYLNIDRRYATGGGYLSPEMVNESRSTSSSIGGSNTGTIGNSGEVRHLIS